MNPSQIHPRLTTSNSLRASSPLRAFVVPSLLALTLASCAEFQDNPFANRATRAIKSTEPTGDASSETMREPQGNNLNLLSVDFGGKKDQPPTVHSILDPLQNPAAANTSATQSTASTVREQIPAAATTPATLVPNLSWQQKPDDKISMSLDNEGNLDVYVVAPSGIGGIVLERTADNWPATIHIHLRYSNDRPFATLEGFTAAEVLGENQKLELKTKLDPPTGKADITIPGFAHSQKIAIGWIDAYR